jgi:hypothetical protein
VAEQQRSMIVQLDTDDLNVRHLFEQELAEVLAGVGVVDGGDIGSGTANVFILVPPARWDEAFALVRDHFLNIGLAEDVVIADDDLVVHWPTDYDGFFRPW